MPGPAARSVPGSGDPSVGDQAPASALATARVEVVVPVHDEQRALPGCLRTLHRYLTDHLASAWTITVVDNASTDATMAVATDLARELDAVRVVHLDRKGRGLALRTVWAVSDADVVVYMDVDLSTGLSALGPLVAPLISGHSDIAIGSRLAPGARTQRSASRELVSRSYNGIIRLSHGATFTDAQCGFKAARTDVLGPLLAAVSDDGWFFDTELLLLAEHNGLRIHEVPVDWVEDTNSSVDVVRTARDDLRGLMRVARAKAGGTALVHGLPRRPDLAPTHPDAVIDRRVSGVPWQVGAFLVIGVLSTVATALLYALFRETFSPLTANLLALIITTVANTEANRRLTFAHRSASPLRTQLQGLLVGALYYAWTSAALLALGALTDRPSRWLEVAVLVVASIVGTIARFVLLRSWVFRSPSGSRPVPEAYP